MVETYTPSLMQLTDGAVHKILSLKSKESESEILNLRVYVTGGGCSGFKYDFTFDNKINSDDIVFDKTIIDKPSLDFIAGSVVDFKKEMIGESFVIDNPKATAACGCGLSFSI